MNTNKQTDTLKRWLTIQDLKKDYGFGVDSQAKMRMKRKIPFSKVGKKVFYCRFAIDSWLENNKIDVVA